MGRHGGGGHFATPRVSPSGDHVAYFETRRRRPQGPDLRSVRERVSESALRGLVVAGLDRHQRGLVRRERRLPAVRRDFLLGPGGTSSGPDLPRAGAMTLHDISHEGARPGLVRQRGAPASRASKDPSAASARAIVAEERLPRRVLEQSSCCQTAPATAAARRVGLRVEGRGPATGADRGRLRYRAVVQTGASARHVGRFASEDLDRADRAGQPQSNRYRRVGPRLSWAGWLP